MKYEYFKKLTIRAKQKTKLLLARPDFQKDILILRKKWKIPSYGLTNEEERQLNLHLTNVFNNDIWSIVRKYRLSPRWHNGIKHYLLFNDPKNMHKSIGIPVKINWEDGIRRIFLEIDDDTTLNDLKQVWSWARKMKRGKPTGKFREIENFDRDKRAFELKKEGKNSEEILNIIEIEFGETLDYNHLNIIINRYKKRLNIN